MGSLFSACKDIMLNTKQSGIYNIGDNEIAIEYYTQDSIIAADTIGDEDEEKIVLFADKNITIPANYTLTPASPKKSLVIYCDTLTNNGAISMYQKAPYVLPHDYFIIGKDDNYFEDVIIPAYANNAKLSNNISRTKATVTPSEHNGNSGTNRQCGSGGLGSSVGQSGGPTYLITNGTKSGSGYAFGGGAGSGGAISDGDELTSSNKTLISVNEIYPMKAGDAVRQKVSYYYASGGAGNPKGQNTEVYSGGTYYESAFGCGGRIIIFCNNFKNNGIITANGTTNNGLNGQSGMGNAIGGSSGAGAIDIFYRNIIEQGIITANGGEGGFITTNVSYQKPYTYVGSGGDGSITLSELEGNILMKPIIKYFSSANVNYLLSELAQRIKESHTNE